MKYKLLKDLPFLDSGCLFRWDHNHERYVHDKGNDNNGAHKGLVVFGGTETKLLGSIVKNKRWVSRIADCKYEIFIMYEDGDITREEFLEYIK